MYRPVRTSIDLSGEGVSVCRQRALPDLVPFVGEFWQYEVHSCMDYLPMQVFPSGCVTLRFDITADGVNSFVYGPSTNNRMKSAFFPEWLTFGCALKPSRVSRLFGLPLHELRDLRLQLDCLWPSLAEQLNRQMAETTTFSERVFLLSAFLRDLPQAGGEPKSDYLNAFQDVVRAVPRVDAINEIARRHQLNHRTMRRYFHQYLGLGAKEMERVARVQGAVCRLTEAPQQSLAVLASDCGYSDQSHFTREFRSLIGQSPKRFASLVGRMADKTLPEWEEVNISHRYAGQPKRVHRFV